MIKYKNILTKQFLAQKYIVERLSTTQIARMIKCGTTTVSYYLKKYAIPIRSISKSKNKYKDILTKKFLKQKYWIEELSMPKIAKLAGCCLATVYYYLKKYNIPIRTHSEASKILSEETKSKMSDSAKERFKNPENNPNWKGGRYKDSQGYVLIYKPNHPHKTKNNYVYEHRIKVEEYLEVILDPKWEVHHINHIRDDNRIENLVVFISKSAHKRYHINPDSVKSEEIIFNGSKIRGGKDETDKTHKGSKDKTNGSTERRRKTFLGKCKSRSL